MAVKPVPDGYSTVTPYLIVKNAAAAIEFYQKAFGATELCRMPGSDGKVMHAEIKIGNACVMLADEFPEWNAVGPQSLGGTSVSFCLYVEDCDKLFERAVAAGRRSSVRSRTSSTAIAPAQSSIRSATSGRLPRTSKTSRPKRCSAGWKPCRRSSDGDGLR